MHRVGLLLGSCRPNGNNAGIAAWAAQLLDARLNPADASNTFEIVPVDPTKAPQPFGPVLYSACLPAQIDASDAYDTPVIRDWSRFIASCDLFVVVTPQYNGGYPGELKNAIDHLYREWHNKPVAIVAFGGHGGNKCAAQLQTVFNQVKMRVVPEPVCITLPRSYITGGDRVAKDGEYPEFLAQYVEAVHDAADKLKALVAETAA
ncbi:hypothetical protein PHLGIDRAFT_99501 [Phlebiopsis gigantea 11061_1 CR5-6]|uniref:NADPH-dependent FMN reductase-like domain-containing protein n=1 Tax=Phlebiopsis gigantea (strain 11061_1 CR5-6) TaxID=745531 RepID=A0A0C3SF29_PHLG1|nr:hypothetical protein PHLGIDRAFT_99501 [Phlebiopsis gigantea 11061_1 CR5-6]